MLYHVDVAYVGSPKFGSAGARSLGIGRGWPPTGCPSHMR